MEVRRSSEEPPHVSYPQWKKIISACRRVDAGSAISNRGRKFWHLRDGFLMNMHPSDGGSMAKRPETSDDH